MPTAAVRYELSAERFDNETDGPGNVSIGLCQVAHKEEKLPLSEISRPMSVYGVSKPKGQFLRLTHPYTAIGTDGGSAKVSYAEPIPKGSHRPSTAIHCVCGNGRFLPEYA